MPCVDSALASAATTAPKSGPKCSDLKALFNKGGTFKGCSPVVECAAKAYAKIDPNGVGPAIRGLTGECEGCARWDVCPSDGSLSSGCKAFYDKEYVKPCINSALASAAKVTTEKAARP